LLPLSTVRIRAQTAPQSGIKSTVQPISSAQRTALLQGEFPAQTAPVQHTLIPMPNPKVPPELMELVKLETEFEKSVAKGGGRAFASWFAADAVTLNNGQPAVLGHTAIAEHATWDPKDYQLTWYVEGAQMGPSGDTAFTWGHYDANGKDAAGKAFTFSGRYTTFWKKVSGQWKVALDASSQEPPDPNSPNAPPACVKAQPR
jgi:ketosteroid isomerase-like protein